MYKIYRIKQFYWYFTSIFKKIDEEFVIGYLNKKELALFKKLSVGEQHHSIRVAKNAIKIINDKKILGIDMNWFIKICLLHDIGKTDGNINIIDKSILVIIDKLSKGTIKKYANIKKIDIYYNHPTKAMKILKPLNLDEESLYIIRNHHKVVEDNMLLNILKESDDIS
ncbi:HDIG domain-containing metalloprotein [Alkaliphilus flagellatus]|uniref:HDIG domain-containing metalloprotein n=1 Tax=Alkaliphilus flagellatus TaxID=2841507 RepID=UPI002ED66222